MVFQNYALYPHMTVRENMGFALKLAGTPREEIDRKVEEAARVLDIEHHLDRKPANLSGGQRQRVAMGRAIVRNPKAFLMDEPLSNLDAKLRVQLRTEISRLHERLGTTTIYVTHDQVEAVTLGDRIAVMRAGRIQQVGAPDRFVRAPEQRVRRGLHRLAVDELPAGPARRRPAADGDRRPAHYRGNAPAPRGGRRRRPPRRDRRDPSGALRGREPGDPSCGGHIFKTKIDVLESLGSDYYAHFTVDSQPVSSSELDELADETGVASSAEGVQLVARLAAASAVKQGQQAQLWVDTSQLHLFDDETGRSLLTSESSRREVPESSTASLRRLAA